MQGGSSGKYRCEKWVEEQFLQLLKKITIPQSFIKWAKSVLRENCKNENELYEKTRLAQQNSLNNAKKKLSNLLQLKISPQNEHGSLLSDEEYLQQKNAIQKEVNLLEEKLGDTSQNESNWIDNCEEFFDFTNKIQNKFQNGTIDEKRIILKNIGKILMNSEEIKFQLQKPFYFALEISEICKPKINSYELAKKRSSKRLNPSFELDYSKWRNGADDENSQIVGLEIIFLL